MTIPSPALTNCTFAGNSADYGGGMRQRPLLASADQLHLLRQRSSWRRRDAQSQCLLSDANQLHLLRQLGLAGGGINNELSSLMLTNCILWGNSPDQILDDGSGPTPIVTYSDIQGDYSGTGNIDADPLFVDPGNGDFHLGPGSPCIDAGTNAAPILPPYDFEGDPRIIDGDGDGTPT